MKKFIEENKEEILTELLGERVTFFCCRYIYTGKFVSFDDTCVKLIDASIVYETGELCSGGWKDAQKLPHDWHLNIDAIESFGVLK